MLKLGTLLSPILLIMLGCGLLAAQKPATELLKEMELLTPDEREIFVDSCMVKGFYPDFMSTFVRVDVQITDSVEGVINGYYYVLPDYLSIGSNNDFIRMPIQPSTAQRIADRMGCFLSTKKICDDVYKAAAVKLEPMPLTENRDSLSTFIKHSYMIEEQRAGREGLVAGHKKDVIITDRLTTDGRSNRVALYGWHKPDGNPIQPVYTGHVDWYVDYSHGIRLVQQTIYVKEKPMHYTEVLNHPVYRKLICDEDCCSFYAYPYKH